MSVAHAVHAGLIAAVVCTAGGAALAGGDRELGEYLSSECVTCHQLSGRFDGIPSIVGRDETDLIAALTEYRDQVRENPVMRAVAAKFKDEEIAALASYFGSLKKENSGRTEARAEDLSAPTPTFPKEGTK